MLHLLKHVPTVPCTALRAHCSRAGPFLRCRLHNPICTPNLVQAGGFCLVQSSLQPSWAFSALSSAGGVLLAKTATGELAWGDVWFNGITTRNPWNINTGSCGSSAGSAVAVAAGGSNYCSKECTGCWGGGVVCADSTVIKSEC
jgi:hypothetical protein